MSVQLTDQSPMPFGKFKGKPMADIEASYFHFLWTKWGMKNHKDSPVADYVRRNLDALKQEFPDGIWS
jgi:hypothetical protein